MTLLEKVQEIDAGIPVVVVTAHGDISMAVRAMRAGAYDFLEKPFDPEHLTQSIRRKLRADKTAPVTRTTANATSPAVRKRRNRWLSAPPARVRPRCAEVSLTSKPRFWVTTHC